MNPTSVNGIQESGSRTGRSPKATANFEVGRLKGTDAKQNARTAVVTFGSLNEDENPGIMGTFLKITKRETSWWRTERPLTSKRVKILLSKRTESGRLLKAIRAARSGSRLPFKVSKDVKEKLSNQVSK